MKMRMIKALLIVCGIFWASVASAGERVLVYTDHEPLGNMRTRFINDVFFPAVEEESNGRLKIEAHWNGELAISYDALRAVAKAGSADMAMVVPEYAPNELPLHQLFKSFPVGPTGAKQIDFLHRAYAEVPAFPEELARAGITNLLFCTGFPVAFFSREPLKDLRDIRGTKWRSASFWHKDFLQSAGAVPITMPWNDEIYKAIRDGALDGLMVNVDSGYDLKVYEVAPNILWSQELWLGHVYLLAMNRGTWEGLAKEDREAIRRAATASYKKLGAIMEGGFKAQIETLEKHGAKVRALRPEEVKEWEAAADYMKAQAAWVVEQEGKGVKGAGTAMEKVRAVMSAFANGI